MKTEIEPNEIIMKLIGKFCSLTEAKRIQKKSYQTLQCKAALNTEQGLCLDINEHSNIARFIRHHCEPNLKVTFVHAGNRDSKRFKVLLWASKRIHFKLVFYFSDELFLDYTGLLVNSLGLQCRCGARNCNKTI